MIPILVTQLAWSHSLGHKTKQKVMYMRKILVGWRQEAECVKLPRASGQHSPLGPQYPRLYQEDILGPGNA